MGKDRPTRSAQQTKIDQYTVTGPPPGLEPRIMEKRARLAEPQGPIGTQILDAIEKLSEKMQILEK